MTIRTIINVNRLLLVDTMMIPIVVKRLLVETMMMAMVNVSRRLLVKTIIMTMVHVNRRLLVVEARLLLPIISLIGLLIRRAFRVPVYV
jgi:hypothetical protein